MTSYLETKLSNLVQGSLRTAGLIVRSLHLPEQTVESNKCRSFPMVIAVTNRCTQMNGSHNFSALIARDLCRRYQRHYKDGWSQETACYCLQLHYLCSFVSHTQITMLCLSLNYLFYHNDIKLSATQLLAFCNIDRKFLCRKLEIDRLCLYPTKP